MGWTYNTLTQAIKDYCEYTEESFVENIPNFIKAAEERIMQSVDLELFRKIHTGALTKDSPYFTVPNDYLAPLSLYISTEGSEVFLINKDSEFVRDYNTPPTTNVPKYYGQYNLTTFILAPTPDQNYTVELAYYSKPESIVTAGTSWMGDNAEQALLYGALIEAYTYMKGEQDLLAQYTQRFTEALLRLKNLGEGRENTDAFHDGVIRTKAT